LLQSGTNTFTLSLFEVDSSKQFTRDLKDRHYVDLAEEGILQIGPKAFKRGVEAFKAFHNFLNKNPKIKTIAIGTAALRRASNSNEFLEAVERVSGIRIQIINGDREANLIYKDDVCESVEWQHPFLFDSNKLPCIFHTRHTLSQLSV
jgi:exopolyphosphatase/guanosine-5'-triphosphate,3'-diphosphate pyrophosphatase